MNVFNKKNISILTVMLLVFMVVGRIGVAFTIVVAFSRIIMGAHFLTDVTVGMSVTVLVISILMNILYKKA